MTPAHAPTIAPAIEQSHELDARHVEAIRTASAGFRDWGRVDGKPNLAPVLCRAPLPGDYGAPSHVRISAADDAPHGRKLYYLWASDKKRYLDASAEMPIGFSIVKESYEAVTSQPTAYHYDPKTARDENVPPIDYMITDKGEYLKTGAAKDLYIMTKVGDVPGADGGWIYGTVAPDGTVTSAGRVKSCMGCHDSDATHEKLFGLTNAPRS